MVGKHFLFKQDFSEGAPQEDFSREELEMYKKQAYLEGYEAGAAQAQIELRHILSTIAAQVNDVLLVRHKALTYATEIAAKVCDTVFPRFSESGARAEVIGIVESIFSKLHDESIYHIRCGQQVKESLEAALEPYQSSMKFIVEGDENFHGSDIAISWDNGFIWRNEVELYEHIKDVLEAHKIKHHGE